MSQNITLQQIAEDCQKYVSLKQDFKKSKNRILLTSKKYATKSSCLLLKLMKQRKSEIISPLTRVPDCTFRNKKCFICNRVGHKSLHCGSKDKTKSSHCRSKSKTNSYIKNTKSDELDGVNTRKFVHVKCLTKV